MNLFFRLMIVFIRALMSKKQAGLFDPAKLTFRVWLTDQDMFMHMTNSRYLSFSDLGTINFMVRAGFWKILRKRNWFPVICAQSMVITRMLDTPNKFQIVTKIIGWTDTYVCISHNFMYQGRQHAEVRVVARFASRSKKPVFPQDLIDAAGQSHVSPPLPDAFLTMVKDVEEKRAAFRNSPRVSPKD
ncbi:MAG: thioesterase family protein [Henriciella sp.]